MTQNYGSLIVGGEEVPITEMGLEWRQVVFRGVLNGPREEHVWQGLEVRAPDGTTVYYDPNISLHSGSLGPTEFFTFTAAVDLPQPPPVRQSNKGTVRERRRKVSAAEAWEG